MTDRFALDKLNNLPIAESADAPDCSAALVLSTSLAQYERESVRVNCETGRYEMPYRIWGRGPALIFIPGMFDNAESFVLPISRLRHQYCCIAYDLPTGKRDAANLASTTHADLVADLISLANHLRLDSATLYGAAFGATIALAALAREPLRFPIGIVQDGFARRPLAPAEIVLARFARFWPGRLGQLPFWRGLFQRSCAGAFENLEPARWPFFANQRGNVALASIAHRALLLNKIDLRPVLPTIRQPVMSISGERESLTSRAREEELRALLPNVARAEIEGCGHLPHITHPEVLCEAIEQFLTACRESVPAANK